MNNERLIEWAAAYLAAGWPVFPCKDKAPLVEWRTYADELPSMEQIKEWWTFWPDAQIALACGKLSGVTVVDWDAVPGGADVETLWTMHGITMSARTGGGGRHAFFNYAPIQNSVKRIHPQADVKNEGGYVILPPSVHHTTGKRYLWDPLFPFSIENLGSLASLPGQVAKVSASTSIDWKIVAQGVGAGQRNVTAAQVAGKMIKAFSLDEDWAAAWEFLLGWNTRNKPPLPPQELRAVFLSVLKRHLNTRI